MRRCADCFHCYTVSMGYGDAQTIPRTQTVCKALQGKQHPVHGGVIDHITCELMRASPDLCGWYVPALFQEKPNAR